VEKKNEPRAKSLEGDSRRALRVGLGGKGMKKKRKDHATKLGRRFTRGEFRPDL